MGKRERVAREARMDRKARKAGPTSDERYASQPTLFDTRADFSPEQRLMANEMAEREPVAVGTVINNLFGPYTVLTDDPLFNAQVSEMATGLIAKIQVPMPLSLQQWQAIQNTVEAAVFAGWQRGRDSRG